MRVFKILIQKLLNIDYDLLTLKIKKYHNQKTPQKKLGPKAQKSFYFGTIWKMSKMLYFKGSKRDESHVKNYSNVIQGLANEPIKHNLND